MVRYVASQKAAGCYIIKYITCREFLAEDIYLEEGV